MPLKPGKKIVISKPAGPGVPQKPASPRKRPSVYMPPQEEGPGARAIWIIVGLVVAVFVIALLANYGKGHGPERPTYRGYSAPAGNVAAPKQEERLWMGEYMKQHGTTEELRARQERVRQHESRRDIVQ